MKQTPTHQQAIRFANTRKDFVSLLNARVSDYFKTNGISRNANSEMIIKTICMFSAYLIPYVLIVSGLITGTGWLLAMVLIMSLGLAGIGLCVMHDACHGAYSKKKWVNNMLGYSLNVIGACAFNWKIQHNVLHHTYTNIYEEDEDVSPRGTLRLTPHSEWKRIHRYQHIYAWFLYGLMTLVWMFAKDFVRLIRYHKNGLAKKQNANIRHEWLIMLGTKLFYGTYMFAIPILFTSIAWWQILIGIFIMHYITGFILAIIFQPAHVIEGAEFPLPDDDNSLENNWAIHQLLTTTNFGNKSQWFSWYVGGLNFQIEHHLFPGICHVHYRRIADIVQETAQDFGLPYKRAKTFVGALAGHARLLRQLGQRPVFSMNEKNILTT
jgi:linoleoyl-CoA desaturase